jgi:hypothetical protein
MWTVYDYVASDSLILFGLDGIIIEEVVGVLLGHRRVFLT